MVSLLKYNNQHLRRGQALVEMLLALALASLILPALLTGMVTSRAGKPQQMQRQQATALAREASDALRTMRDQDWTKVATNGTFHPVFLTNWSLSPGAETVSGFSRSIVIADVCRSATSTPPGQIVACGGTSVLDPSTKLFTVSVSWTTPSVSQVTSSLYLTRYNSNATYIQTTAADFPAGTK